LNPRFLPFVLTAVLLAAIPQSGLAEKTTYPERPIRFIVPYAPGGTADFVARIVADGLTRELGEQVVVDNRAGAASTLGMALAAEATPDGYTIAINNIGLAVNETLRPHRSYQALKDLTPISLVGFTPSVLVVNKNLAAKTTADLIRLAKSQPGTIPYGSAGAGSSTHLSMTLFEKMAGISLLHVPYKGGGPAIKAMIAGEVQCALVPIPTAYPHIQSGLVRPLAVTGTKPSAALPGVPPIAQTVPGYEFTSWYGLLAPHGTPATIIEKLDRAAVATLSTPEVTSKLQKAGLDAQGSTPSEFGRLIRSEIAKWRDVIESSHIAKQ
jgi:tripartite-type tricarboxylate transporter receptor subunit TctC